MAPLSAPEFKSSKLHLVIWNRIESSHHAAAMVALHRIMDKPYADEVMPLIRPIGRSREYYTDAKSNKANGGFRSIDIGHLENAPMLDEKHTAHCEVWFQVSLEADAELRADLSSEFKDIDSICFFWDHTNPMWVPFPDDRSYARSRKDVQDYIVSPLSDERAALLLKIIWNRAALEIAKLLSGSAYAPLDPRTDHQKIHDLMESIFPDIDLLRMGITEQPSSIVPTDSVASHMAAFAVNAVTTVSLVNANGRVYTVYRLEDYYQDEDCTRPYNHPDRGSFLQWFFSASAI